MQDSDTKYSKNHTWVRVAGDYVFIGVTEKFMESIDDIVDITLPDIGEEIVADEPFAAIDDGREIIDVVSPISGEIVKVNKKVKKDPAILNEDPLGDGWLIKVDPYDWDEIENLLDEDDYEREIE
jgi:glycine cleavage system H protein